MVAGASFATPRHHDNNGPVLATNDSGVYLENFGANHSGHARPSGPIDANRRIIRKRHGHVRACGHNHSGVREADKPADQCKQSTAGAVEPAGDH